MKTALLSEVIESERLRLVPTSEDYVENVFAEFTEEIAELMFPRPAAVLEEALDFIRTARERMLAGDELSVAVLLGSTGEFLGHAGIYNLRTETPELGIWIKASAHGHGYGREAVAALTEWARKNLQFSYLKYPAEKSNVPSRKLAESLGGVLEDEYEEPNMSGKLQELVEYRIYP